MNMLPQASLFLGIIPALIILFIALKGYDGYYKDKYMFLTFIIGIIFGFIAAFVQSFYPLGIYIYQLSSYALISILLLAVFEQLFKTIILNVKRLHQKKETPIYGLSLGLGFGSSFTPFMIIAASASSAVSNSIYILSIIALGSVGLILFHGATGIFIGYGIFEKKLTRNLIISIILDLPILVFLALMIFFSNINTISYQITLSAAMIIYGLIIFIYVAKKVLPGIKKNL